MDLVSRVALPPVPVVGHHAFLLPPPGGGVVAPEKVVEPLRQLHRLYFLLPHFPRVSVYNCSQFILLYNLYKLLTNQSRSFSSQELLVTSFFTKF